MTSISLPGASGSSFVRSVFTCWPCVAVANPKVKINTERMSFFMLCIASVLSLMYCDNRKVRLRQTVNGRANCRFPGIFVELFNSIAQIQDFELRPTFASFVHCKDSRCQADLYTRNATRRVSELSAILLHQEQAGEIAKTQLPCVRMSQPRLEQKPWQPLSKFHVRNIALGKMISSGKYIARLRS